MKIHILLDTVKDRHDLIAIARAVAPYTHGIEVGILPILQHGVSILTELKKELPAMPLIADAKIILHGNKAITLLSSAGVDAITVLAGAHNNVIRNATNTAHEQGKKIILDLSDACANGQSALEAKSLGVDSLRLYIPHESVEEKEPTKFIDTWEIVHGNTTLPIFIAGAIDQTTIARIIAMQPAGIIIGSAITEQSDPAQAASEFYTQLKYL